MIRFFISNLWLWKCGLPEKIIEKQKLLPDVSILRTTQMNKYSITLMENRMIMGTFRYGKWQDNKKEGKKFDRIGSIQNRLDKYKQDGNDEHLVDIANLSMIEFSIGEHPKKHFGTIDDGEHVKQI